MVFVRNTSGARIANNDLMVAKPDYGLLVIGGGTDFVSAGTAAEVVDGTGVAVGLSNGATLSASAGSITIDKPGVYRVGFKLHNYITGNAGVVTANLFKNAGAFTQRIRAVSTAAATAVQQCGLVAERFELLAKGDAITLSVSTTVGTVTITEGEIYVEQITDTGGA